MQRFRTRTSARLFKQHRSPSSFPAGIPESAVRLVVLITMILLMSAAAGPAERARAESVLAAPSENAVGSDRYVAFVREAAQRFGVPASWIGAVMAVESGGDVRALSSQGAMGLMQIMPDTWAGLRARHRLGVDPFEPRDNILAGAAYLREMHDRYGSPGFLAAYNAGPGRYDDYLATGRELPAETRLYVAMLAPLVEEGQTHRMATVGRRVVAWQESSLFAVQEQGNTAASSSSFRTSLTRSSLRSPVADVPLLTPQVDGLFVRRRNASRTP